MHVGVYLVRFNVDHIELMLVSGDPSIHVSGDDEIIVLNDDEESSYFTLDDEPSTYKEAMLRPDSGAWRKAILDELFALKKNGTFEVIDRPPNVKPIDSKWVFKIKTKPNGEIDKYKARLVAKGYSQIPNKDFNETYSPVTMMTTIRLMLAIANHFDMDLIVFDVKTAFLNGDLDEEIFELARRTTQSNH